MANGHGGYRRPNNPAPVSGPGALSQRTDGGPGQPVRPMTGGPYGEGQELATLQSSAPMAKATGPKPRRSAGPNVAAAEEGPIPLSAPSQYPDEPVTTGIPLGPGAGPEVLSSGPGRGGPSLSTALQKMLPYDKTGEIGRLLQYAQARGW